MSGVDGVALMLVCVSAVSCDWSLVSAGCCNSLLKYGAHVLRFSSNMTSV